MVRLVSGSQLSLERGTSADPISSDWFGKQWIGDSGRAHRRAHVADIEDRPGYRRWRAASLYRRFGARLRSCGLFLRSGSLMSHFRSFEIEALQHLVAPVLGVEITDTIIRDADLV